MYEMRNKDLYPENWYELAQACKDKAGWRCECTGECGRGHSERCEHTGSSYKHGFLDAAHISHDIENPTPELRAMCRLCHRGFDRLETGHPNKVRRRKETREKNKKLEKSTPKPTSITKRKKIRNNSTKKKKRRNSTKDIVIDGTYKERYAWQIKDKELPPLYLPW